MSIKNIIEKRVAERLRKKIELRIMEHLYNTANCVDDVVSIQGAFNYKCFYNAVQHATDNGSSVVMGIIICDKPVLHFWCKGKDGNHLEVSIGYQAKENSYYPMRIIDKSDWKNVDVIFSEGLDYWLDAHSNWLEKKIINLFDERVV